MHILFELQVFKIKKEKTCTFTVCRHTTKGTKVLYRVSAHDKGDTWQQPVDLGALDWTKWSLCRVQTHGKDRGHGKGRHTATNETHKHVHVWSGRLKLVTRQAQNA
jgi:hypothetical protein